MATRVKTEFLATVSHDFHMPTKNVTGMTQVQQEANLDEKQRLYVDTIDKSGQVLLVVVQRRLGFLQHVSQKVTSSSIKCDVHNVLRDIDHNPMALT